MKIFVTTSDNYHHILPIFFYLYEKYWGDPMTLIGYETPNMKLPDYCTWVSIGKQGNKYEFCRDMRYVFSSEADPFIWMMEDTFIRELNRTFFAECKALSRRETVGRVSLTNNSYKYYTLKSQPIGILEVNETPRNSDYRLSLQPAIWKQEYLLKHLKDGYSAWDFENQCGTLMTFKEDRFDNVSLSNSLCPLISNEGVRRFDLHRYDFTGFAAEDIIHLKKMGYEHSPWTR